MIDRGNRVLPQQSFFRNQWAKIARQRSHVAMRKLVPSLSERFCELLRILVEALRDRSVNWVEAQSEVRGQHGWRMTLGWIVRIRHHAGACAILWCPLMSAGRALGQFPVVLEQVGEEVVAPLRRRGGPNHFQAAADRVAAFARAKFALPAKALFLNAGSFRLGAY